MYLLVLILLKETKHNSFLFPNSDLHKMSITMSVWVYVYVCVSMSWGKKNSATMCQSSRSVGTTFLQNSEESNEESNQITKKSKGQVLWGKDQQTRENHLWEGSLIHFWMRQKRVELKRQNSKLLVSKHQKKCFFNQNYISVTKSFSILFAPLREVRSKNLPNSIKE